MMNFVPAKLDLGELLAVIRTTTLKFIQGLIWTAVMATILPAAQGDERLKLVSADVFENVTVDGQTVQILSGSVIFRKGDMELRTTQARYYRTEGRTRLMGDVLMIRPGERLTCDTLVFYNAEDRITAEGDVRFEQTDQTVESREFNYWTELDSGIARYDVVMTQEGRQLIADEFHTWKTEGPREASFKAYGSVLIDEGGRRISGDLMRYDDIEEILHLTGDAHLHDGNRDLRGEIIRLVYRDEILEHGYIEQGAEASSVIRARMSPEAEDTRLFTDLLSSRTMEATFTDEKLSQLELRGMASSMFHVIEDSVLQGVNSATGDTIGLAFDSLSNLNRITVRGGARGRFVPEPGNSEVDTLIDYKAEFIDYHIPEEITYMEKGARVDYRENGLSAGTMVLTWRNNMLRADEAHGEPPTLYQAGRDPMEGEHMEFDLIAERGRILKGRTKLDNGYYHGALIHRYPDNVYYVKQSKYTTCDLVDQPHFYFASNRMKMLQGDKVIAKPLILYLADVPLIGLPFAVFPNKAGGRRSGLIMPGYGESRNHGQYLDGLGYFWVMNSYADATTMLDFYDRRGVLVKGQFRYKKLYKFGGSLRSTYNRSVSQQEIANLLSKKTSIQWDLKWIHNHTIDPTQRLNINATYTSNPRMYRDLGKTLETRLKQQVVSNASYTKNWRGAGASFKLALSERYDLLAEGKLEELPHSYGQKIEERTRTLPLIGFSLNQRALIKTRRGQEQKWYHKINYSFRNDLNNRQSIFWEADSVTSDSLFWPVERTTLNRTSATNNISLSTQQNVFKYLSTTLSLGLLQAWTPTYRRALVDTFGYFLRDGNTILYEEIKRITPRHTGQISLSAQTNIYGLFPIKAGRLQAIRHIFKPRITYTYVPDFSKPLFGQDLGYFQEDRAGVLFDKFQGSTIGGTRASESQSVSLAFSNRFQSKREIDDKEVKSDLLDWNMSTAYDFTADSLNWAPIRSSFRSPFLKMLNLDISMTHDFYAWDEAARRKVDRLLRYPRLSNMNASTSLKFSGSRFVPLPEDFAPDTAAVSDTLDIEGGEEISIRRGIDKPQITAGNLWDAGLSFRYSLTPALDPARRESFTMNGNIKASIGPGWKVRYSATFDMLTRELTYHDLQLYRELHCWEFAFSWTPSGPGRGFLLRINVRDGDLQDIEYESRGGSQSRLGL